MGNSLYPTLFLISFCRSLPIPAVTGAFHSAISPQLFRQNGDNRAKNTKQSGLIPTIDRSDRQYLTIFSPKSFRRKFIFPKRPPVPSGGQEMLTK
ncbi:hypothetical protein CDAR_260301 [Caerostris darwini]|uniref:Secreted protein n=1 Tax=Caerostris darwini TaxID=1538125 RepID=A0AAV4PBG7_9ARAC|nr:hypothetical protein CDAR_260301 [Caerostris darwini]